MRYRIYDPERDQSAAHRIWREVAWVENEDDEKTMDHFLSEGRVLVSDIDGEAECLVASTPGDIRYLDEDLPLSVVSAVTTSRLARKQGLAGKLTAQLMALDAADGAAVSTLGMFEQGYYNRLGFGTGSYEHWIRFDPASLNVPIQHPAPRRLTSEDGKLIHETLLRRRRGHGSCNIYPASFTESELRSMRNGFGLGYYDGDDGALSHFLWCTAKGESGPYRGVFMAYHSRQQFLDLMAVLRSFGDQVHMVRMREPAHIQMQDLLRQPFKQGTVSRKSDYATGNSATAYWQMRICDLHACLARTHLDGEPLRFNLILSDPVADFLDSDAPWRGIGGEYVVTLGPESTAKPGSDSSLPVLAASVGAFTRLWLGVRPANGLAITDDLSGPDELLDALDGLLRLPVPHPDWDF